MSDGFFKKICLWWKEQHNFIPNEERKCVHYYEDKYATAIKHFSEDDVLYHQCMICGMVFEKKEVVGKK